MRVHVFTGVAVSVCASLILSGCGGGAKSTIANPQAGTVPLSGARLILTGTIDGSGPQLLAGVHRPTSAMLHRFAFTFKSILVEGTFFPGDAGANPVSNSVSIAPPVSGIYTASVPFSNVPIHSNEWGLLQFTGVAADGSKIALGELGGIVDVTSSSTNSATFTEATTRTFQVFTTLLQNGYLGTNDLDTSATLASTLTTQIGAAPFDPTTHLFTSGELTALTNSIAPGFERNATITASPATNGSYVILRDYTNASELDLVSNVQTLFTSFAMAVQPPKVGTVDGASTLCGGFSEFGPPSHTPETNPQPLPAQVDACVLSGIGATTVRNIYGGHLLVGATSNAFGLLPSAPPYTGGFTAFAGHAPGTFPIAVTTASTQQSIKVTDLAGFAFGAAFEASQTPLLGTFFMQNNFGAGLLSATSFFATTSGSTFRIMIPTPYSASSNTLTVDKFNLWDIASTNEQICGGVSCYALTATQPLVINRPFADGGNKLTFFGWKASGTATAVTQGASGYNVTISGAGTATLTTTVASVIVPRQRVVIANNLATPSTWTVTAKDSLSNVYADSAVPPFPGEPVTVEMDSVGNTVTTTQIAISFTTLSPGVVTISNITAESPL
jgi:hypothetical protein